MIAGAVRALVVGKTQVRVVKMMPWSPVSVSKTPIAVMWVGRISAVILQANVAGVVETASVDRGKIVILVQRTAHAMLPRCARPVNVSGSVEMGPVTPMKPVTTAQRSAGHVKEAVASPTSRLGVLIPRSWIASLRLRQVAYWWNGLRFV
jgi:hypothetical protein